MTHVEEYKRRRFNHRVTCNSTKAWRKEEVRRERQDEERPTAATTPPCAPMQRDHGASPRGQRPHLLAPRSVLRARGGAGRHSPAKKAGRRIAEDGCAALSSPSVHGRVLPQPTAACLLPGASPRPVPPPPLFRDGSYTAHASGGQKREKVKGSRRTRPGLGWQEIGAALLGGGGAEPLLSSGGAGPRLWGRITGHTRRREKGARSGTRAACRGEGGDRPRPGLQDNKYSAEG